MWLILVGLTLLAQDVLSQANKVINSETDLLALESDQLIHSSAELLALEDQISGLPFGTKLPGYEKPLFAYSYTVKDTKNDIEKNKHLTTVHKPPDHNSNEASKNFIYLQNFKFLYPGKKQESITAMNTPVNKNDVKTRFVNDGTRKDNSQKESSSKFTHFSIDCDDEKKTAPSSIEYNDRILSYHKLQPTVESMHFKLGKQNISSALSLEYLPPFSPPRVSLNYLPPERKSPSTINLDKNYLPPSKIIHEIPVLSQNYLPPTKASPKAPVLNLDYLPPLRENIKPLSLKLDYLPPSKEIPTLHQDYLPPRIEQPEILNIDYLPPKRDTPDIRRKPSLKLDYLPPQKNEPQLSVPDLSLDYLPPSRESFPLGVLNKKYSPPIGEKVYNSALPLSVSKVIQPPTIPLALSSSAVSLPSKERISPGSAFLTVYLPSASEFKDSKKNEVKTDISPSAITNPPIGLRRKENKITPDVITEEIKDQPVFPIGEHSKIPSHAVIYEHRDKPIKALKDYSKLEHNPIYVTAEKKLKPDVSYKETVNPLIIPTAKYSEIKNYVVSEEKEILNEAGYSRKKISNLTPHSDVKSNVADQPIRASLGKPHTTHSPIEILTDVTSKYEISDLPIAVQNTQVVNNKIVPLSRYSKKPLSVTYEERVKPLPLKSIPSTNTYVIENERSYMCISNDHCPETCICHNGQCILGCSIAKGLCIGDANCETRHHVPACVCPLMSIAKTVQTSGGLLQFDCEPMMMSASTNTITDFSQKPQSSRINLLSYQRPIIAPVRSTSSFVTAPISHSTSFIRATGSGNACNPSPCGPNTRCEVNNRGIALCRCIDDYVPDGHTINGCKPQCSSDGECPDDYQCQNLKCVRVCIPGACGLYADCDARNHRAECKCPATYGGDPHNRCTKNLPQVRIPDDLPVDPCIPNPCGSNAACRERGDRAVCSCPIGYEGNPLTNCIKGECIEHDDCPDHRACQGLRCIDPCVGVCGSGAECTVRNHQPVCSCPRNHLGDPFANCRKITEYDVCNPTPCGQNTNCKAKSERDGGLRAVCSCVDNYIGSPLTGCRPECERDTDCSPSQNCQSNRCRNPCVNGCGEGAYCDVRNHQAVCTCPEHFLGDAHSRCYTECTEHDDCRDFEACSLFRCINPCEGACGTGADCKVERHTPICSCPRGYTGDPFVSCRAFTLDDLCRDNPCGTNAECHPGKDRSGNDRPVCTCPRGFIGNPLISCRRGDCEDHNSCADDKACYGYTCQSPCVTERGSVCGENADCKVKNHTPVCSCPRGYSGNPLENCRISPSARIAGRSHRKQ